MCKLVFDNNNDLFWSEIEHILPSLLGINNIVCWPQPDRVVTTLSTLLVDNVYEEFLIFEKYYYSNVVAYSHYEKAKDVENSIFDPMNRVWIC